MKSSILTQDMQLPSHIISVIKELELDINANPPADWLRWSGSFAGTLEFIVDQYIKWPTLLPMIPLNTVLSIDIGSYFDFEECEMLTKTISRVNYDIIPMMEEYGVEFKEDKIASAITLLVNDFQLSGWAHSQVFERAVKHQKK